MDKFIENITSFPTGIYTLLLLVCIGLMLISVLGLIDIDGVDVDLDANVDLELDVDTNSQIESGTTNVLSGLLIKYKLVGVPITISITLLILIGWMLSYYIVHFVVPFKTGTMFRYLSGLPIFLGTLLISPIRKMFRDASKEKEKLIIGQVATVRTSKVDHSFGEVALNDGGAGLILKVRATGDEVFKTGDKVVVFEKIDAENNIYRVISEEDFLLKSRS